MNTNEYYTIDILHIAKTLWQKAWMILLSGILAAIVGFCLSAFAITPTYSSSIMLYVNNSSASGVKKEANTPGMHCVSKNANTVTATSAINTILNVFFTLSKFLAP